MNVPMSQWGKDHWSTFAYIETRIVDHGGRPDREHMRVDPAIHPQFSNSGSRNSYCRYPTRLRDGEIEVHDDWSCLDDCEAEGLVRNVGTGLLRVYTLTEKGRRCASVLRDHKAKGGMFSTFTWVDSEVQR